MKTFRFLKQKFSEGFTAEELLMVSIMFIILSASEAAIAYLYIYALKILAIPFGLFIIQFWLLCFESMLTYEKKVRIIRTGNAITIIRSYEI